MRCECSSIFARLNLCPVARKCTSTQTCDKLRSSCAEPATDRMSSGARRYDIDHPASSERAFWEWTTPPPVARSNRMGVAAGQNSRPLTSWRPSDLWGDSLCLHSSRSGERGPSYRYTIRGPRHCRAAQAMAMQNSPLTASSNPPRSLNNTLDIANLPAWSRIGHRNRSGSRLV